jgi:hypothetical protein
MMFDLASNIKTIHQVLAPAFQGSTDTLNLLYGFINGAVDVFPIYSMPRLCRDNATQIYQTADRMI